MTTSTWRRALLSTASAFLGLACSYWLDFENLSGGSLHDLGEGETGSETGTRATDTGFAGCAVDAGVSDGAISESATCTVGAPPVRLLDDPANCGACDRTCSFGVACDGGTCLPQRLLRSISPYLILAVRGSTAYAGHYTHDSIQPHFRILAVTAPPSLERIFDAGATIERPSNAYADDDWVYVEFETGIRRFSMDGREGFVATGPHSHMTGDDRSIYAFTAGQIVAYDKASLQRRPVVDGGAPVARLEVDETRLFWLQDSGPELTELYTAPLAGGEAKRVAGPFRASRAIALGAGFVYLSDGEGRLGRVSKNGGAFELLGTWISERPSVSRVVVDGRHAFFVVGQDIVRVPICGGVPLRIARLGGELQSFVQTSNDLLWGLGTNPYSEGGRVPK